MFFFFFKKVVTRRKDDNGRAFELLAHLDGAALEFYYGRFTVDGKMNNLGKEYK